MIHKSFLLHGNNVCEKYYSFSPLLYLVMICESSDYIIYKEVYKEVKMRPLMFLVSVFDTMSIMVKYFFFSEYNLLN